MGYGEIEFHSYDELRVMFMETVRVHVLGPGQGLGLAVC